MTSTTADEYVLGHDPAELERLEHQAALLAPATTTLLTSAGIQPGMRVLDLGTGAGDVALLVAELVGPHGTVVGVDRSVDALGYARVRAVARAVRNVEFRTGDVRDYRDDTPYDAVVGRLVLLYTDDPAAVIRHHVAGLKPGGVVLAMEYDLLVTRTVPAVPTTNTALRWAIDAFYRCGLDVELGPRLATTLRAAGLEDVHTIGVQPYPTPAAGARLVAGIVHTLSAVIERTGIATESDMDLSTLTTRIQRELEHQSAVLVPPTLVGAWATVSRSISS